MDLQYENKQGKKAGRLEMAVNRERKRGVKEKSKRRAKERKTELEGKRKGKEREIVKLGLYEKGRRDLKEILGCIIPVVCAITRDGIN